MRRAKPGEYVWTPGKDKAGEEVTPLADPCDTASGSLASAAKAAWRFASRRSPKRICASREDFQRY